jgi:hypothetical protein
MRKRTIATVATTAAFVLGVIGVTAYAETPPTPSPSPRTPQAPTGQTGAETQEPAYTGSIRAPQGADSENEAAALAKLAKVTEADARNAALAKFPGATIQKATLEDENGNVVWAIELTDATKAAQEVKVDAGNGAVLAVEAGGADNEKSGKDND